MLSLGEVLAVAGERADVRVWLATGGVIDVELPAVNANLLEVGARVVVAFAGEGEDSGIVLGAIDGSAAAAATGHTHGGADVTSAVASAVDADTVDGQHAAAFAASGHNHSGVYSATGHTHGGADVTSAVASAVDADTVDGQHASAFADASHTHSAGNITDIDSYLVTFVDDHMISTATVEFSPEIDGMHAEVLGVRSLTTAARDALTAANGMLIYNSTTGKFQGRASGAWVDLH